MSKWIAEFDLEDGDTMPEHMDLNYMGAKIDFHCRPMWIPVSERLPEKEMNCLVTDSLGKVHTVTFYQALDGRESYFSGYYCVRAWMPLPEPYKAEREDKK